jgi:hypothetical protein
MRQGEYFLLFDSRKLRREGELHSIPDLLGPDVLTMMLCVELSVLRSLICWDDSVSVVKV